MPPDPRKLLADALAAADDVVLFTSMMTYEQFVADERTRAAVYWKFTIIGEALAQLRKADETTFDAITESWKIVGFRNQIIHGYSNINDVITWNVIETKLPVLIIELRGLLEGGS